MKLKAEVTFYFDSESVRSSGAEIGRLGDAAAEVGFEIAGARVEAAPPPEVRARAWTSYAPLDDPAAGTPEG